MSSQQDEETRRAAIDKAYEGARLLSARDYEGAIKTCTEAIALDPTNSRASRTRAEAQRRLGMAKEDPGDPRNEFCRHLRWIGVKASLGKQETRPDGADWVSEWLVDIDEGSIRHVLIWERFEPSYCDSADHAHRGISYLVPDSRIGPDFPPGDGASPALGCWVLKGSEWSERGNWLWGTVSSIVDSGAKRAPARMEWDRLQSEAHRVLEAPAFAVGAGGSAGQPSADAGGRGGLPPASWNRPPGYGDRCPCSRIGAFLVGAERQLARTINGPDSLDLDKVWRH